MIKAVYPGSFDPITYGHLDVIKRGIKIFDKLIVAVADNIAKQTLFTKEERVEMIKHVIKPYKRVYVDSFSELVTDYAKKQKANVILRGIRTISDFENEFQMALTNRGLASDIETIFVMTHEEYSYINSRLVKEIAMFGGDIKKFVPKIVEKFLREKFKK